MGPIFEDREKTHDPFYSLPLIPPGFSGIGSQKEVFLYSHVREESPPFRYLNDPFGYDFVRRKVLDGFTQEFDASRSRFLDPLDGIEKSTLTCSVRTQQGHEFALLHLQTHIVKDRDDPVGYEKIFYFQHKSLNSST
jgi:hypothetical protein